MADTRLSDLSAAGALSASDLFYVVQTPGSGGEKATGTQLLTLVGTTYLAKAGGTMTGALTLPAGTVSAPALLFTGGGTNTGVYLSGASELSIAVGGVQRAVVDTGGFYATTTAMGVYSNTGYLSLGLANDIRIYRDAAATLAQRNGTAQQIFRLYNTYTDASNYERLTLTGVAGTSVNITAETLGTGGDNIDVVITPAGTGNVKFGTHSAIAAETVTGYITIKDAGGTTRKLAVVS